MKRIIKILSIGFIVFYSQNLPNINAEESQGKYRLFKTTNMWNFLKLDTERGFIWQVQFDVKGDDRFTIILNDKDLLGERNASSGRFMLYPTENRFTFILLDQLDGRTWQVQWSFEAEYRFIMPIESLWE